MCIPGRLIEEVNTTESIDKDLKIPGGRPWLYGRPIGRPGGSPVYGPAVMRGIKMDIHFKGELKIDLKVYESL